MLHRYGVVMHPPEPPSAVTSLHLDGARLRRELHLRGVTASVVAKAARVSPNTLTRCLAGDAISHRTLRSVIQALHGMPVPVLADELVAPLTPKTPSYKLDALDDGGSTSASSTA